MEREMRGDGSGYGLAMAMHALIQSLPEAEAEIGIKSSSKRDCICKPEQNREAKSKNRTNHRACSHRTVQCSALD